MRLRTFDLAAVSQISLNTVNILFLCYLVIYAIACPNAGLVSAVAIEIAAYGAILAYRIWKSKQKKSEDKIRLEALHDEWKPLERLRTSYRIAVSSLAILVVLYMSVDLIALLAATTGNEKIACSIYKRIAPPASPSLHPGFSTELLAGAYIEANKFEKAERLELSIIRLRESIVGDHDELIADSYGNLGDFYSKAKQFDKAESNYKKAIALTKDLHLRQGYGNPMTKLGSIYTEQGRYAEAQDAFNEALAVRSQIFGSNSEKVAETLRANVQLLNLQGRSAEAGSMKSRIAAINSKATREPGVPIVIPIAVSVCSLAILWKRDRILLFAANLIAGKRH
jgi:hypothetical protein